MTAKNDLRRICAQFPANKHRALKFKKHTMRTRLAATRLSGGKKIVGESLIECLFYKCAELILQILALITQPFTAVITTGEKPFEYTPDAIVMTALGAIVIECKPSREYFDREFQLHCRLVTEYFAQFGLRFVVIDEHDVGGWALQSNLARLWRVRMASALDRAAQAVADVVRERGGRCSVAALRGCEIDKFGVDRALAQQLVFTDLFRQLDDESVLSLSPFGDGRDLLSKVVSLPVVPGVPLPAPIQEMGSLFDILLECSLPLPEPDGMDTEVVS